MKMKCKSLVFIAALFFSVVLASSVQAATVSFSLRAQDALAVEHAQVEFPVMGTVTVTDSDGVGHQISSQSVLGLLVVLDEDSDAFRISNLQYFPAFGSLYVKCITISQEYCDNWQYVANGNIPPVGMDQQTVSAGDSVWLFFGDNHRVRLSSQGVNTGESFTVQAESYQYVSDTWVPLGGVTAGVTRENPEDSFSPIEVLTSPVDEHGRATFQVASPGEYLVGIKEDFYFPTVSLTAATLSSGGGGSTVASPAPQTKPLSQFSTPKAIQFLESRQKEDGSFGAPLFSDWVAVALGTSQADSVAKDKLKSYLLSSPEPGNLLTDYERRAMALMALGVDPAHGTSTDYIKKILEAFDGTQFGDLALVNDDVFALLVLSKAGYASDERARKSLAFVVKEQELSGSFANSSDMTAAAIQALVLFPDGGDEMNTVIGKAKTYLKLQQLNDGGFGNAYATAWALQAISALKEVPQDWARNEKTPLDVLASEQREDGSVGEDAAAEQRIWATAYAIPAASGLSWGAILESFEAEEPKAAGGEESQVPIAAAVDPQDYRRLNDEVASLRSEIAELKQHLRPSRSSKTEAVDILSAVALPPQQEPVAQQKTLTASVLDAFVSFWNTVRNIF